MFFSLTRLLPWLGVCLLGGTGCAFFDKHVELCYPPTAELLARDKLHTVEPRTSAIGQGATVILRPFTDGRASPAVGQIFNTNGTHTADVLPKGPVTDWVTEAVRQELAKAGFRVFVDGEEAPAEGWVLAGEVSSTSSTAVYEYEAEVGLGARLTRGEQVVFEQSFVGAGGGIYNVWGSEPGYSRALALALHHAAVRLVNAVVDAAEQAAAAPHASAAAPVSRGGAGRTGTTARDFGKSRRSD